MEVSTISTTQDLIHALESNQEFREAARRLLLSQELLDMPNKLAALTATVDRLIEKIDRFIEKQERINEEQQQFNAEQRQFNAEQQQFNAEQRQFNEEQQQFNAEQRQFNAEQQQFNAEQRQFNEEQQQFNAEQRQFNKRMENAIGELRGNAAIQVVRTQFKEIAKDMGFRYKRVLSRDELVEMFPDDGVSDISAGDRRSFFRADMVIEVTSQAGEHHYIAVEASYTADERDTQRAWRNAVLLQRFTERQAYAAIAGVRAVNEIQATIDSGDVHWFKLDPDDFTPE